MSLASNPDDGLESHEPEPTDIVVCLALDTEPDRELTTRQARRRVSQNTCGERATRLLRVKSERNMPATGIGDGVDQSEAFMAQP